MNTEQVLCAISSSSMSGIIGNVTGIVKNHIIKKFPKDYFNNIMIDTFNSSIYMEETDINITETPAISFTPRYELSNETVFGLLPYWRRISMGLFRNYKNSYKHVLIDDNDLYYIFAVPDRVKIIYDVKLRVSHKLQAMDIQNFIRQSFRINAPYFLNQKLLEGEVPKIFIDMLMKDRNVDKDDPFQVNEFFDYLKNYSDGYITMKNRLATGSPIFSYRYRSNLLCKVESMPETENTDKNLVNEKSTISFQFSVDFWTPLSYAFITTKEADIEIPEINDDYSNDKIIMNYTLQSSPPDIIDGNYSLLYWTGFLTDENILTDILPFETMLSFDHKLIIENNNSLGRDNNDYFKVVLYRDENILELEDYQVDWEKIELKTFYPLFNVTYHLGIYGNKRDLNELLNEYLEQNS
jgi:hypothetical protein